eukprot:598639-Pyramimonas_sp.AAC.1
MTTTYIACQGASTHQPRRDICNLSQPIAMPESNEGIVMTASTDIAGSWQNDCAGQELGDVINVDTVIK